MQGLSEQTGEGAACIVTWHGGHHWRVAMKDSARPAIRKSICMQAPISTLPARPLAVSFPSLQAWKARSYQTLLSIFLRLSIKHLIYVLENPLTLSHEKPKRKPIAGEAQVPWKAKIETGIGLTGPGQHPALWGQACRWMPGPSPKAY